MLLFLVSDRVSLKAPETSSFTNNLSSVLIVRVAGAAVDGLFHVTAVGLISIVQIAVSGGGGSGNESESVVTEYAVGRRGRAVGKSPGSEVSFASGIR